MKKNNSGSLSSHRKSIYKSLTWRITASADTFAISLLITGKIDIAGAIAGVEVFSKILLYYLHERAWSKKEKE
jgi:uncharacterized membrane protein